MVTRGMTRLPPTSFFFIFVFFFFLPLSSSDQTAGARGVERRQAAVQGGRSTTGGAVLESAAAGVLVGICASVVIPSGYKCHEFTVETRDGYILSMQRIPEGRNGGGGADAGGRRRLVLLQHGVLMMYTWLGIAEFDPKGFPVGDLLNVLCQNPNINCSSLMTSLTGANCCLNESTVKVFLQHEPQPTSTRNMVHLAQTFRDGNLAKFDYGSWMANERRYGQARPPTYNMSNIPGDLPLFLSYGGEDCLSNVRDVQLLLADLRTSHDDGKLTVQYVPNYAHADFIMGTSAKRIVYDTLVTFLNSHK